MYKYIFFDLDGTLTDPGVGITNSIIYSLKKFNIEVSDRTQLYKFIGPPLLESYAKYFNFSKEEANKAVVYYREYFTDKGIFENEVYDGIPELLSKLKDAGIKLVLATSKPEHFALRIMEHFELAQYFCCMCGSSQHETQESKADVIRKAISICNIENTENILMVGDRLHDIEGAKACGLQAAGVMWGYGSVEEFKKYNADYIVNDLNELSNLIFK